MLALRNYTIRARLYVLAALQALRDHRAGFCALGERVARSELARSVSVFKLA